LETIVENSMADSEENVIRVSGSTNTKSLASVISHAVSDNRPVVLRCVGAASVSQGVKAVAVASQHTAPRGFVLSIRPGFTTISMPDREAVSALLLRVIVN
jgi:stage V sporulation protein SpoVS